MNVNVSQLISVIETIATNATKIVSFVRIDNPLEEALESLAVLSIDLCYEIGRLSNRLVTLHF